MIKRKTLKSENGVTLIDVTIYIITMLIIIGIVAFVSQFFYDNIGTVKDSAKYAGEFDKINSNLIVDVKANKQVTTNSGSNDIVFEDGTVYTYNSEDNGVYRGKNKIAINVKFFSASSKTINVNGVQKEILTVKVIIGNSSKNLINKQIDYTLKYW